ncbi:MAG: hypothetical protein QF886_21430, partial [Planctomycetota bacterium]|nr:hypothetical protein [Planctomycetota bacterium]
PTFLLPTLTKFQSGRKEKMPGDEFLAFPFLHDVICVPPWLSRESQTLLKRIQKELRAFGTAKAEFLPYWSNEKFIQTDPPIRVSAYLRRDASAMMLLAQGPETDGEVTIAFRDRLSGFKGRKVSVINQERIPQWRGEGLMCPMPARKLCVFSIEATE